MKKTLFYIVALITLISCKPSAYNIGRQFVLDNAVDPSSMRILSHSEVLRSERTKLDTSYFIAAIDTNAIVTDSIRIDTRRYPEHYYCYWTIEGNDSIGKPCRCNIELAVLTDGSVIFYSKYRDLYYVPFSSCVRAQRDTLTDIRTPIFYKDAGVWAPRQLLENYKYK